jgi:hypothetical protein
VGSMGEAIVLESDTVPLTGRSSSVGFKISRSHLSRTGGRLESRRLLVESIIEPPWGFLVYLTTVYFFGFLVSGTLRTICSGITLECFLGFGVRVTGVSASGNCLFRGDVRTLLSLGDPIKWPVG